MSDDQSPPNVNEALLAAVKAGDPDRVRRLLKEGGDLVFWRDAQGQTIQHYSQDTNAPVGRLVLDAFSKQYKALLNQDLIYACRDGDVKQVKDLIAQGADIDARDLRLQSPLHHAVERDHVEVVRLLVDAKANLNLADGCCSNSPLHVAYYKQDPEIFKMLVAAGADVNHRNRFGNSLLQLAAMDGKEEIVKLLIEARADLNAKDHAGNTPLSVAANRHPGIYDMLIRAGATAGKEAETVVGYE